MQGLLALLSDEIVLYSDRGGKASAVPNPIYGPGNVAKLLLGAFRKFVPRNLLRCTVQINGHPGVVNYHDGHPHSVLTVDTSDDRIRNIYIVTNPEELERLPVLPASPC